ARRAGTAGGGRADHPAGAAPGRHPRGHRLRAARRGAPPRRRGRRRARRTRTAAGSVRPPHRRRRRPDAGGGPAMTAGTDRVATVPAAPRLPVPLLTVARTMLRGQWWLGLVALLLPVGAAAITLVVRTFTYDG